MLPDSLLIFKHFFHGWEKSQNKHYEEYAADHLEQTYYEAERPAKRGDWWQIEFSAEMQGAFTVYSGTKNGQHY